MDFDTARALLPTLVDKVLKRSPSAQCDLLLSTGQALTLSAQKGEIDKCSAANLSVLGLRIVQNGRVGLSYSESFDGAALDHMIGTAFSNLEWSDEDPYQEIVTPKGEIIEKDDTYNAADNSSIADKKNLALTLESAVTALDSRVQGVPYSGYQDRSSATFYLNHYGHFCYHQERMHSCSTSALMADGGRQALFYAGTAARKFSDLDVRACAAKAVNGAAPLLKGVTIANGRYAVVFTPDALSGLWGAFDGVFSGKAAKDGKSLFKDKVGTHVASSALSIHDDPGYQDSLFRLGFDGEGVPRKRLTVVASGELKSLLHNHGTAKFFGTRSTGHASRAPKSGLGVSASVWVIDSGKDPESAVYAGKVFKVTHLQGLHAGTNPVSGNFSLAVEGALLEDGVETAAVRDVTLAGNFYTLLQQASAVGQILHGDSYRGFFCPEIRFEGLSVAGQ